MLTKEQIDNIAAYECDFDGKRTCANCEFSSGCSLRKMADQSISAIDLAAENERLKAKLDEVKAECLKPIMITSDVFGGGVAAGHNILKQAVLAIIKDGDNE